MAVNSSLKNTFSGNWQQFLVMVLGILVGVLGSGCLTVWLTTYDPTAPTTKTISKSEWVR